MSVAEILEAEQLVLREELGKLALTVARYRMVLEQHGIEPPDDEGAELLKMWRDCATVVTTASEFSSRLGSAKELLADWSL